MNNDTDKEKPNPLAAYAYPEISSDASPRLKTQKPVKVADISNMLFAKLLTYSPYEEAGGNFIAVKEFIEEIQVTTQNYQDMAQRIVQNLTNAEIQNNCISFLTAFPGVGKTTFINWLVYFINHKEDKGNEKPTALTEEVNNGLSASYINCAFKGSSERNGLKTLVAEEVSENFDKYRKTLEFIIENEDRKELDCINIDLFRRLLDNKNPLNRRQIRNLIDQEHLYLDGALLFLLLHQWIERREHHNDPVIIFFMDNLDALNSIYLYDIHKNFWKDLSSAYTKFQSIVGDEGGDPNKLKLFFTLRNYNYTLIRGCFKGADYDIFRDYMQNQIFDLKPTEFHQILDKRTAYAISKKIKINQDLLSLVEIIQGDDPLFRDHVYSPLFNYDIRNLNQHISRLTGDSSLGFTFSTAKNAYDNMFESKIYNHRSGARGIILHSFIRSLFTSTERYPVEPLGSANIHKDETPFCSECRLLLTVVYNLSYRRKLDHKLSDLQGNAPTTFSLADLITSLRVHTDEWKQVIPTDKVLEWLVKFNGTNNESRIHLIDLSGVTVEFQESESKTKPTIPEVFYNGMSEIELIKRINEIPKNKLRDASSGLSKIHIKINPSAVVYLRYLISHFEFFAAYKYWQNDHFISKFKPLFLSTELKQTNGGFKYEFQSLLEDVFELVKYKKRKNDRFLTECIFRGGLIKNTGEYLKSNFAFITVRKDGVERGSLYSSRVLTTHLHYIDAFRSYLSTNEEMKELIRKNKAQHDSLSLEEINLFILNIEKKYVSLYLENDSPEHVDLFDIQIVSEIRRRKVAVENKIKALKANSNLDSTAQDEITALDEIHLTD